MSVDTTFKPHTPLYAVDNTAGGVQVKEAGQTGSTTFRIRNTTAANAVAYVGWAATAALLPTPAAPAVGTPKANVVGIPANGVVYLEVPPNSFFIGSAAAPNLEIQGGIGGEGG